MPKLLEYREHSDGRRYLITAYRGRHFKEISTPRSNGTPFETCLNQAYINALQFIDSTGFPQLMNLTSQQRCIDGFVMPPSWLSPDIDPPWKGKENWEILPLEKPDYVFQHGDLASNNLMMDPQTLQLIVLFDWEYAGYFPPEMEKWLGSLDSEAYHKRGNKLANATAKFLPAEYTECYNEWGNKAELDVLIESEDLPHPNQLRQA